VGEAVVTPTCEVLKCIFWALLREYNIFTLLLACGYRFSGLGRSDVPLGCVPVVSTA